MLEEEKELIKDLSGPRAKVLCGKVSEKLANAVYSLIERNERYKTVNDFVEKAIHDLYVHEVEIERESNVE